MTADHLTVTILGSGSSAGVPRIGGDWGACDPTNPRNRRRRCSILVDRGATRVLVDTAPDMREQLLDAEVKHLDAVLFTHDHADQCHGIDDLRVLALNMRRRVPVWADDATAATLTSRFAYCFAQAPGSSYPAILAMNRIAGPMQISGPGGPIDVLPFVQEHGNIDSLGFRFGDIAYSSDLNALPEESYAALEGVKIWVVDALRYRQHPSHFSVDDALRAIERVRPAKAYLTNLHVDLDYETLCRELPEGVEPAYDGMRIDVPVT